MIHIQLFRKRVAPTISIVIIISTVVVVVVKERNVEEVVGWVRDIVLVLFRMKEGIRSERCWENVVIELSGSIRGSIAAESKEFCR